MKHIDERISIIGFLFSLSIAFWGGAMVEYVMLGPPTQYQFSHDVLEKLKENLGEQDHDVLWTNIKHDVSARVLRSELKAEPHHPRGVISAEIWVKDSAPGDQPATPVSQSDPSGAKVQQGGFVRDPRSRTHERIVPPTPSRSVGICSRHDHAHTRLRPIKAWHPALAFGDTP